MKHKRRKKDNKFIPFEPNSNGSLYRTIKMPLNKILSNQKYNSILQEKILIVNEIAIRTMQFIKLYYIYLIDNNKILPELSTEFIKDVITLLTKRDNRGKKGKENSNSKNEISCFYTDYYEPQLINTKKLKKTNINTILNYLAKQLKTNYETNIRIHFKDYIARFINKKCKDMFFNKELTKEEKQRMYREFRKVKDDLLLCRIYKSDIKYHNFLNEIKQWIIPNNVVGEYGIHSELSYINEEKPDLSKYLKCMILINKQLEINEYKLFNPLCLRDSITPKYIKLDTTVLIDLFLNHKDCKELSIIYNLPTLKDKNNLRGSIEKILGSKKLNKEIKNIEDDNKFLLKEKNEVELEIKSNPKEIYIKYFNDLENEIQNNNDYITEIISNDSRSTTFLISLLQNNISNKDELQYELNYIKNLSNTEKVQAIKYYLNRELWNRVFKLNKILDRKNYMFNNTILTDGYGVSVLQVRRDQAYKHFMGRNDDNDATITSKNKYIDELNNTEIENVKNSVILGCDPGKKCLIKIIDENRKTLSYTQQQRAFECKFKYSKKKIVNLKKTITFEGKTIEQIEQEIKYNSKSCNFEKCKEYIKEKHLLNEKVKIMYNDMKIRKLKFTVISNKKKSEDNLINRIRSTYGKNITILYGDWGASNKGNKMRNIVSTPNIGLIRKLERCAKIYLVDEYKTSKLCHCCKSETDYYKSRTYYKKGIKKGVQVHGLLRCQNELCGKFWNRDTNGSSNILEKGKYFLENNKYPEPFKRIAQSN